MKVCSPHGCGCNVPPSNNRAGRRSLFETDGPSEPILLNPLRVSVTVQSVTLERSATVDTCVEVFLTRQVEGNKHEPRLVGSTDSKLKSKGDTMAEQQFTPGERLVLKVKQRKSIMNRSVLIGSGFLVLNQERLAKRDVEEDVPILKGGKEKQEGVVKVTLLFSGLDATEVSGHGPKPQGSLTPACPEANTSSSHASRSTTGSAGCSTRSIEGPSRGPPPRVRSPSMSRSASPDSFEGERRQQDAADGHSNDGQSPGSALPTSKGWGAPSASIRDRSLRGRLKSGSTHAQSREDVFETDGSDRKRNLVNEQYWGRQVRRGGQVFCTDGVRIWLSSRLCCTCCRACIVPRR